MIVWNIHIPLLCCSFCVWFRYDLLPVIVVGALSYSSGFCHFLPQPYTNHSLLHVVGSATTWEGGIDSWEPLAALWIMNPDHFSCSCPSLNLTIRAPSEEQCFKPWLAPEQPEVTYADSSEECWRCWWARSSWKGGWESSLLWGSQPGMAGCQQWSLQARCCVWYSLQLLSHTVLTYFSRETASTWRTRNASTNSRVVLSIYSEVQQAALVFFSEEGELINFYIKTIALITKSLDKMQQQLLFSWCVVQALGCALWVEAGRGSLPGIQRDEALKNFTSLRISVSETCGGCFPIF